MVQETRLVIQRLEAGDTKNVTLAEVTNDGEVITDASIEGAGRTGRVGGEQN